MKKLDHLLLQLGKMAGRTWLVASFLTLLGSGVANAQIDCLADAGTLTVDAPSVCFMTDGITISADPTGDAVVPEGYATFYLLTTGEDQVVAGFGTEPEFEISVIGSYTIHTLVYDPASLDLLALLVLGVSTSDDLDALLVQGGGIICGSLDLTGVSILVTDPDAGGLTALEASVCLEGGMAAVSATADGDMVVPDGYEVSYLLTMGAELVVMQVGATPSFMVDMAGMYTIHTLVYDSSTFDVGSIVPSITTGLDIHAMLVQGGGDICASLDAGGAAVTVAACGDCTADAGGIVPVLAEVCLGDSTAMLHGTPDETMVVPDGYVVAYVLTSGEAMVIEQMGDAPHFFVDSTGMYTIHTLVYHPDSLDLSIVQFGVTTAATVNSLLIQGGGDICASLDLEGAMIDVVTCGVDCMADAGGLAATSAQVCLEGTMAQISATATGGLMVPDGYSTIYVLTMGEGLVIAATSATPTFNVESTGMYTIHTLVYHAGSLDLSIVVPGVTTGFDVNSLLIQGGGEICGSLDVEGAMIEVVSCDVDCMADAGGLEATSSQVCMEGTMTEISATATGGLMVPDGYSTLYVLTMGEGLVIAGTSATPSFSVESTGMYTIHTLVYHPDSLDLSIVVPGVTTGFDVNSLLIQGGGEICGSLDVEGAMIHVIECSDECLAYAGSLVGIKDIFCYMSTGSVIGATVVGDADVPPGYVAVWIASHGAEHVIEEIGDMAWFVVDGMGLYTIHTLVYNPATLDLSTVDLGTTTISDLHAMLIQGGGMICASLDTDGVSLTVDEPLAGMITPASDMVCLEGGSAVIEGTVSGTYLPMGYSHMYVLTMGESMTIVSSSSTPSFMVSGAGTYAIHTLVLDTATFPLDDFTDGMSTIYDLNGMLVSGGGVYCAALDVEGSSVSVMNCDDECTADAGSLQGYKPVYCYSETGTNIGAIVVGDATVPAGYQAVWVVTHGESMVIEGVNETAYFIVDGDGLYTIHTLVYNPATLDLSTVTLGVTTAAEVNALLIQGGGEICASLDLEGVSMIIDTPMAGTLSTSSSEVCLEGGSAMLSASVSGSYLPMGYTHMYILSMNGTIMDTSMTSASFEVSSTGSYTIHTAVHSADDFPYEAIVLGSSTVAALNAMLIQGGGEYCVALDLTGVTIDVTSCDPTECTADAGTLTPDLFETCLSEGTVIITAESNMDMVVPAGYSTLYLLSMGTDMTVMDMSTSLSFEVDAPGSYYFHTLVYHPSTWEVSMVDLGVSTAMDLHEMLIQGGGSICASLDMVGASTMVIDCSIDCTADAGTITADTIGHCLSNGTATLMGVPGGDMVVPTGYSVVYVLTQGLTPVVHSVSATPSFTVTSEDIWRIHTLVYDTLTLDLSTLTPGMTTAMEVNALLIQGGGSICASLDIYGAMFTVIECSDCLAFAGSLTADTVEICLDDSVAYLDVSAVGDAIIPDGYTVIYVLTEGEDHTIVNVADSADQWVDLEGDYTIHTLVYDPATLDLSFVLPGETTALDLLAIILANQDVICASLDLSGVTFTVVDCGPELMITNAWPVPATDQLTVELNVPTASPTELVVMNVDGTQVMPGRSVGAGTNQVVLNVGSLSSGYYVIRLMGAEGVSTYSFTKIN